ncbi:MAG TPA: hypothetical protein VGI17_11470 [Solirubrobacterales bacterium]|jgi:AcrR family transcriptional regulator
MPLFAPVTSAVAPSAHPRRLYKHFDSRDDLVAEAVEAALAQSEGAIGEATADAEDPLAAFVDWYLSPGHRDDPATGCAVAAFSTDAARGDARVRAAYGARVERYIAHSKICWAVARTRGAAQSPRSPRWSGRC